MRAGKDGDGDVVKKLLKQGVPVDSTDEVSTGVYLLMLSFYTLFPC